MILSDKTDLYLLERYKYILAELASLNAAARGAVSLFQTLTTAIIGGGVAVFLAWHELTIAADVAGLALRGLAFLQLLIAAFTVLTLIAILRSWMDYRSEEVALLNAAVARDIRKSPSWANWPRWSESYMILFVFLFTVTIHGFTVFYLLPMVR